MGCLTKGISVWSVLLLGSLTVGVSVWQTDSKTVLAHQAISPASYGSGLITHVQHHDNRPTQLIVVDTAQKRIAVYLISQENGEIKLKSVRNIGIDLTMQEFNSGDPSPLDISGQKIKERN